jgi:hypothetical protein
MRQKTMEEFGSQEARKEEPKADLPFSCFLASKFILFA